MHIHEVSFSRRISTYNVQWQLKHRDWAKGYSSGPSQICSSSHFLLGVKLHVCQYPQQHLQSSFLRKINAIEIELTICHKTCYNTSRKILFDFIKLHQNLDMLGANRLSKLISTYPTLNPWAWKLISNPGSHKDLIIT